MFIHNLFKTKICTISKIYLIATIKKLKSDELKFFWIITLARLKKTMSIFPWYWCRKLILLFYQDSDLRLCEHIFFHLFRKSHWEFKIQQFTTYKEYLSAHIQDHKYLPNYNDMIIQKHYLNDVI